MDRAAQKIIVENGGKHPASLTSLLNLLREKGSQRPAISRTRVQDH